MVEQLKEVVISKEDAVFWMDRRGRWHNEHGPFQNKKIIDYFHTCIRKDANGFYLSQVRDDIIEKVYFPYEETALFVFNVRRESNGMVLVLNTGEETVLDPAHLCIREDVLALMHDDTLIKFTDRTMMKVVDLIEEREGGYCFTWGGREWIIKALDAFPG
jgi:hypothetical protein